MLLRKDKQRLPVAVLPNGSGDDFSGSLGIDSIERGLQYIIRGEIIKVDTVKCLIDCDDESELGEIDGIEKYNFCRHMLVNSGLAMPAIVGNKAKLYKDWFGKACYTIATLVETARGNLQSDTFELTIDGQRVSTDLTDQHTTLFLMGFNGKSAGGARIFSPYSFVNDGLCEIVWISDPKLNNLLGVSGLMNKA